MNDAQTESAPLRVNRVVIAQSAIDDELAQHHAEPDPAQAARRALAVRELLRQRAAALGLLEAAACADDAEDAAISRLIDIEAAVPVPTEDECRRFYAANPRRFSSGELVELRHILFAVTPRVPVALLRAKAESTLFELQTDPARFAALAAELSNCPSAAVGGNLGQIGRDDCVPEFADAVFGDAATGVLPRLIKTRFGFHIVLVERRIDGKLLPFELVHAAIAAHLADRVRRKALYQYLRVLAGAASIEGVELDGAESPLLQ